MGAECRDHGCDLVGHEFAEGGLRCPQCDLQQTEEWVKTHRVQWLVAIAEQCLDAASDTLQMAREIAGPKDLAVDDCYVLVNKANALVERLRDERGWRG